MQEIEIYTSKKKSLLLLIGSAIFVVGGVYMFINSENMVTFRYRNPHIIEIIGIASVLFFGLGIFVSIKQLIQNKLMLVIGKRGININPRKSPEEVIEWKFIEEFNEVKIHSTRILIIKVTNHEYWIEKENNIVRKKMMEYNTKEFHSPFNFSTNTMQINHDELMNVLNENLKIYKYGG